MPLFSFTDLGLLNSEIRTSFRTANERLTFIYIFTSVGLLAFYPSEQCLPNTCLRFTIDSEPWHIDK